MSPRKVSTTLIAVVVLLSLACAALGVYAVRQSGDIYSAPVAVSYTHLTLPTKA